VKRLAFVLLFALLPGPALAGTLALHGAITQGGLVRGQTEPGARVALDGNPVRIAPDGHFIFGFGRDAPKTARLDIVFRDGTALHRVLAVVPRRYDIRRIDNLPQDEVTPPPEILARVEREDAQAEKARTVNSNLLFFESRFLWPVVGRISGVYGSQSILDGQKRAPHMGVDIAAPPGTPVRAPAGGTVTLAAPDFFLTGGTVMIDHGYGLSTVYFHLSRLDVHVGQKVAQGEVIGAVGATGRATGPHLHWGVNWYQLRLDPALLAGPMPALEPGAANPASADAARATAPAAPVSSAPASH
jgi:murein DD-endopeptidase MepM/ murein hydrolase activator NlpD